MGKGLDGEVLRILGGMLWFLGLVLVGVVGEIRKNNNPPMNRTAHTTNKTPNQPQIQTYSQNQPTTHYYQIKSNPTTAEIPYQYFKPHPQQILVAN